MFQRILNMKRIIPILKSISVFVLLIHFSAIRGQGPELQEYQRDLESLLSTVDANGRTYRQNIVFGTLGNAEITVNEVNSKGEELESKYEFALSDINPRAVRKLMNKDIIRVELFAKGNQKLIKKNWDGGNKIAYVSDFILYAADNDNGMDLKQAFQESVPFAIQVEKNVLSLNTYDEHLNWLISNINNVKLADERVTQGLQLESGTAESVVLKQVKGGHSTESVLNLSHLNANSTEYHISGDEIFIEVHTKGGKNGVKYSVDGAHKDYRDFIRVFANSITDAKKIYNVLQDIIPLAESEFKNARPDFDSNSETVRYINDRIKRVVNAEGTFSQQFSIQDDAATVTIQEVRGNKNFNHEYSFSLTDINPFNVQLETKKTIIFLELIVKNNQPFIRHIENDTPQNYRHYIRLYFDSREDALLVQDALKTLIRDVEANKEQEANSSRMTIRKAWENIASQVSKVENGEEHFDQRIQMLDNETSALKYTKHISNPKKNREIIYEFGAKEVNPFTTEIHVSGSRVWVELITRNKKKAIKVTENGEARDYHYIVEIEANSIANAKEIMGTFKKLSEMYDERIGG